MLLGKSLYSHSASLRSKRSRKGPFTQAIFAVIFAAIFAAIFLAIPNRPCKLAAILWRFRGNFLAILWRFYDLFSAASTERMRC